MNYFDHAATTPLHPEVIEVMLKTMKETFGNPSSIHQYGRKAHEILEEARQIIATSLNVQSNEIIFTSGGTEGANTAILGVALANQEKGKHLITTRIEHPAVLEPFRYLETLGFEVTYLPVDSHGQLQVAELEAALRPDTQLVSVMAANNETGNLLPIQEIGTILNDHPAIFHTDAVQAYGKIALNPKSLGVDLLSISAHKLNGPKGVGFLYKKQGLELPSLIRGGEQEAKQRAGTENLAGIVGMAHAISKRTNEVMEKDQEKYAMFAEKLMATLDESQIDYALNGDYTHKLSHVLNIHFPGVRNDLLLLHADLNGYAISTGSACSAGTVEPSHVLEAMYGEATIIAKESIRISFGQGNTIETVENLAEILIATIKRLKH